MSLSIERCTALADGGDERIRTRVEVGNVEWEVVDEFAKEEEMAKEEEEEAKDEVMESISGNAV